MAWDWESGQCYVEGGAFEDIMSWGLSEGNQKEEEDSTSALIPLPCLPSPPSSEQSIGTGSFHNKATDGSFDSSLNEGFCLGGPKQGTSPLRRGLAKKTKSASRGGPQTPKCQVESCHADLAHAKDYHRRHKVCNLHSKASTVVVSGSDQRFCQQCSRFHLLKEFDEGKRSCRKRLAGHNERRRKFQPDTSSWIHSYFFQGGTDSPPAFMSSGISFSWEDKCKFYPAHEIWPRMVKSVDQSTLDFSTGTAHFSHLSHKTHDYNDDEDKHPPFVLGQSLKGSSISQQGVHCYHYNDDHGQSSSPLMQGLTLTLPFSLGGAETHAGSRVPAGTDCALSLQQPPQSNNTTMTVNSLMNPLLFQLNSLDTTICPPIIGQQAYDVAPTSICPPMTGQQTYDVTTRKLNMIPPLMHMDKCISTSSGLLGDGSISNGDSFNDGYNNNHNASFLPSLNGVRSSSSCSSLEGIGGGQQVGSIMENGRRLPPFCSPNFHATYCPPSSTMVQITEHGEFQALHPFESTLYGSI